ncbi:MAG: hypothetical protein IH988_00960 [Planctomycetes bacterium]|nr:hypothetical protein [Planctomycetota bacterium]
MGGLATVRARFGCDVDRGDSDCDTLDQNADGMVDPVDLGFILSRLGACPRRHDANTA